ncbi:sporulation integral membrane protein YlbJ [Halobacillus sp. Marseille-P3879]|uniref:sporulation integral membrane protein YlbJ n=1 Tax=Halobacillus TaxID=45667 RepID=UPI000C79C3C2|nr:sporulation integral membrane protein YlbJ [Halobacillus sp. Marseille-P3879]
MILPYIKTFFLAAFIIYITVSLIQMPDVALSSSTKGLNLWWSIVFPSLLPFFIVAELLFGLGVVHGVGILSEKFMRPLFNVPGSGGFVWIMGMASGYPAGAKWTRELRINGQVTRIEAERLVAFTNASSPLFILSAVSVGFFGDPGLGVLLAAAHYGGCIIVGFLMRFYGYKDQRSAYRTASFSIKEAFISSHKARLKDGRPFGKLLGDAVIQSVQTLLLVGGFIILFSVLTGLLKHSFLLDLSYGFLHLLTVPSDLHFPVLTGLLELTTGIGEVTSSNAPLLTQLCLASFMLGFHGFSIQAQIASILADTDIRFTPYLVARMIHGITAVLIMFFLYQMTDIVRTNSINVSNITAHHNHSYLEFMYMYGPIFTIFTLALAFILSCQKIKQSHV